MIGIYFIRNKVDGRMYIGQSKYIKGRISTHKTAYNINNHTAYNNILYTDMRRLGIDNFVFGVVEECAVEELCAREMQNIIKYDTLYPNGYNSNVSSTIKVGEMIDGYKNERYIEVINRYLEMPITKGIMSDLIFILEEYGLRTKNGKKPTNRTVISLIRNLGYDLELHNKATLKDNDEYGVPIGTYFYIIHSEKYEEDCAPIDEYLDY